MNRRVGKKATGDRRKRLSKRERQARDSRVHNIRPIYLNALATRIAGRVVGTVLTSDNIKATQDRFTNDLQLQLENQISEAIQINSETIEVEDFKSDNAESENFESGIEHNKIGNMQNENLAENPNAEAKKANSEAENANAEAEEN